jgi:hypothetical protein
VDGGEPAPVTTTFTNAGAFPATDVQVGLTAPAGWTVAGFVRRDAFGRASAGCLDRCAMAWLAAAVYVATLTTVFDSEP